MKKFYALLCGLGTSIILAGIGLSAGTASALAPDETVLMYARTVQSLAAMHCSAGLPLHLLNSQWSGTVTFVSGANAGGSEQTTFNYYPFVLHETASGAAGDISGNGVWIEDGNSFCSSFAEPVPGQNIVVFVTERGTIAADGQSYIGYGTGVPAVYDSSTHTFTDIPGASGNTVTNVVRQ